MKKVPIIPHAGPLMPELLTGPTAFTDGAAGPRQPEGLYQAGQYTQAAQVYGDVLSARSEPAQTLSPRMGTAIADAYPAHGRTVNAGVEDIRADRATDPRSVAALAQIGEACDKPATLVVHVFERKHLEQAVTPRCPKQKGKAS